MLILRGTPVTKVDLWSHIDAHVRKLGERNGLDTRVVLALNDVC